MTIRSAGRGEKNYANTTDAARTRCPRRAAGKQLLAGDGLLCTEARTNMRGRCA